MNGQLRSSTKTLFIPCLKNNCFLNFKFTLWVAIIRVDVTSFFIKSQRPFDIKRDQTLKVLLAPYLKKLSCQNITLSTIFWKPKHMRHFVFESQGQVRATEFKVLFQELAVSDSLESKNSLGIK